MHLWVVFFIFYFYFYKCLEKDLIFLFTSIKRLGNCPLEQGAGRILPEGGRPLLAMGAPEVSQESARITRHGGRARVLHP